MRQLLLLALAGLAIGLVRQLLRRPAIGNGGAERGPWDPYAVLGVRRGASRESLTDAYRARLKEYHPDRVADLGPELRDLAHQKTLDIQRAYDELSQR